MNRIHMALLAVPALLLLSTQNAYAYLDPGTGSMILQGLIGGIAGGMFAIRIYWGRLKSRFGRAPVSASPRDAEDAQNDKVR
jgi:nitrate/nitrite transporter NarK